MSEPSTERFGKYRLKGLNFGDITAINSQAIFLSEQGMSLDLSKMLSLTIKKGALHKDGTPLTDKEINEMPVTTAQEVYRRILLLTGLSIKPFQTGVT